MLLVALALLCATLSLSAQPYGMDQRPLADPFLNGSLSPAEESPSGWVAAVAFPQLTFDDLTCFAAEPRTNLLCVGSREGAVYVFKNDPNTTNKTLFLDLTAVTQGYNDCGLLGMAFHPEFGLAGSTNRGYVYISYSYSPAPVVNPPLTQPSYNRLSRFTVPDGSLAADPGSELVLINQFDPHVWHNGGGMFFGSDGFLYLSNGDSGGNDDQNNNTQKINSGLFSGVLRLDVDMNPSRSHPPRRQPQGGTPPVGWPPTYSQNYYIPNDNPWLDPGGSVLEEFFAIGFRSPHRMTFDPPTGRIWLGDVGQNAWEEVDLIEKGGNYQWAYMEGTHTGPKAKPGTIIGVDKPPIYDYPHASGNNSVIGGYVYRGTEHAAFLTGQYLFSDNGSCRIWAMNYDGVSTPTLTLLCVVPNGGTEATGMASFGVDQNNELYMCVMGFGVRIYKLARAGSQSAPPPLLSQTGAFTNLASLSPNAALLPYTVNTPLWSDNAVKSRWLVVPNDGAPYSTNETIGFATNGAWSFPIGTVFVKHFELPINDTNPAIRKRLETRFLVRGTNGSFYGLTYKWRADNSDADLLPGSLNETNLITTATGVRTQVWYYPSRQDCLICHNANAKQVLGVRTCQLNGEFMYPDTGVTDNQLRTLSHIGMFATPIDETNIPSYPKSVPITDTSAPLEARVRSYLDANCAQCHRPNGARAFFDARLDTPLANQGIINGPVANSLGITGAKVVSPQNVSQSLLYVRDNLVGLNQMPPLAKNTIDTNYIDVLAQWINGLPPLAPPLTIGNTDEGFSTDSINANSINGLRHQATANLTVDTLYAKVGAITGKYQCAIYSDNNNLPGVLLGKTAEVQNPGAGWQTFALTSPVTLTNGQYYWLAIWVNAGASVYYSSGSIPLRYGTFTYGTWPSPLTLPTAGTPLNYCIYATGAAVVALTASNLAVGLLEDTVTNLVLGGQGGQGPLSFALLSNPTNGVLGSLNTNTGAVSYQPNPNYYGVDNFRYRVSDGSQQATGAVSLTITAVNDAPTLALATNNVVVLEDSGAVTLPGFAVTTVGPANESGQSVTNIAVLSVSNASLLAMGPTISTNGTLSFTPATNQSGVAAVTVQAQDNGGTANGGTNGSAAQAFTITVSPVNDAPVAKDDDYNLGDGVTLNIPAPGVLTNDSDVDGDSLTTILLSGPLQGTLILNPDGGFAYTPTNHFSGVDIFTYQASDGQTQSGSATVSITVSNLIQITSFAVSNDLLTVSWTSIAGKSYRLQYKDNWVETNWTGLLPDVSATGPTATATNATGGASKRFYRMIQVSP